jgi:hypothetical protein
MISCNNCFISTAASTISATGNTIVSGNSTNITDARVCFAAGGRVAVVGNGINPRTGVFIFGDNNNLATVLTENTVAGTVQNNNCFRCRFTGGYAFFSNAALTTGAVINPGANAWSVLSDRKLKKDIHKIVHSDVLEALNKLDVYQYRYKDSEEDSKYFYGIMVDEWNKYFIKDTDNTINTMDIIAACIASIKALKEELDEIKSKLSISSRYAQFNKIRTICLECKGGSCDLEKHVIPELHEEPQKPEKPEKPERLERLEKLTRILK